MVGLHRRGERRQPHGRRRAQLRVEAAHGVIVSILRAESASGDLLVDYLKAERRRFSGTLDLRPLLDGRVSMSSDSISR